MASNLIKRKHIYYNSIVILVIRIHYLLSVFGILITKTINSYYYFLNNKKVKPYNFVTSHITMKTLYIYINEILLQYLFFNQFKFNYNIIGVIVQKYELMLKLFELQK